MRCHYCDREAAVTAEKDGLTVGLCAEHFRERIDELTDAAGLTALEEHLDGGRSE